MDVEPAYLGEGFLHLPQGGPVGGQLDVGMGPDDFVLHLGMVGQPLKRNQRIPARGHKVVPLIRLERRLHEHPQQEEAAPQKRHHRRQPAERIQ